MWKDWSTSVASNSKTIYQRTKFTKERHLLGTSCTGQNVSVHYVAHTDGTQDTTIFAVFFGGGRTLTENLKHWLQYDSCTLFHVPRVFLGENQWRGSELNDVWYAWQKKKFSDATSQNHWINYAEDSIHTIYCHRLPSFIQIDPVSKEIYAKVFFAKWLQYLCEAYRLPTDNWRLDSLLRFWCYINHLLTYLTTQRKLASTKVWHLSRKGMLILLLLLLLYYEIVH